MSQARRMRHFARIANCRVRLAWFMNCRLCVIQAEGGGGRAEGEMNKNFTYMKYSPEKKHTAETGGKKYTQDKQTNKHPKTETCPH